MVQSKPWPAQPERRILNCLPSRNTEIDWTFGAAMLAGVANAALPESRDLREKWWEVGDQGSTGSCVGWAAADAVLRWHFVKAGWIAPQDHLSVRFAWMASKETDELASAATTFIEPEGTSLKAALDVARRLGSVLDDDLPFAGGRLFPDTAQVFYTKAARLKIASYINLELSLTSWRRWIANNGPILVRLNADDTWHRVGEDGVLDAYHPETAGGGHAVALVGYDRHGFIVRNSWGSTWGDNGFAYATDAYAVAAFTEAYGVTLPLTVVSPGLSSQALEHAGRRLSESREDVQIEDVEGKVMELAREAARRPDLFLAQTVGDVFNTPESVERLVLAVEKLVGAKSELTDPVGAEDLARGSFYALADAALRRTKVRVWITRAPAATVVFIDGVQLPQTINAVDLPPGRHTLKVRIAGAPRAKGTGTVSAGDAVLCRETAQIPEGFDHAYSSEGPFNV